MRHALALTTLLLAACAGKEPQHPPPPEIVRVPVDRYVGVPPELTRDCGNDKPREQTYAEAKRLALVRDEHLEECTARMRRIRALPATP